MVALLETSAPVPLRVATTSTSNGSITIIKEKEPSSTRAEAEANRRRDTCDRRRRRHRRVHFGTVDDDSVREQVFTYQQVRKEEKSSVYSSKKELKKMRLRTAVFADEYARDHPEWIQLVDSLILNEGEKEKEELLVAVTSMLAESEARGLELCCSSLLQNHQQWATKSVLGRYQQLQLQQQQKHMSNSSNSTNLSSSFSSLEGDDDDDADSADTSRSLLRRRCESVNRCAREMAFQMGLGDELLARRFFAEEPSLHLWLYHH